MQNLTSMFEFATDIAPRIGQHAYAILAALVALVIVIFGYRFWTRTPPTSTANPATIPQARQGFTMTRMMDATTQKVWMMWTEPEHFVEWFGVPPFTASLADTHIDLRLGGTWETTLVHEKDGTRMKFYGTYSEIDPQKKLSFSIISPISQKTGAEMITVIYKDVAGKTEMTLHQNGNLAPEEYAVALPKGYGAFFDRMANRLMLMH